MSLILVFAALFGRVQAAGPSTSGPGTRISVRHIIPPYNPALDAVHAPSGFGTGKIWHVGPNEPYKKPSDVARLVHNGDIVEIDIAITDAPPAAWFLPRWRRSSGDAFPSRWVGSVASRHASAYYGVAVCMTANVCVL